MLALLPPASHRHTHANARNNRQTLLDDHITPATLDPHWEAGTVINVNYPAAAAGPFKGLALTHQGSGCVFPK
jgi:hypothetical protein